MPITGREHPAWTLQPAASAALRDFIGAALEQCAPAQAFRERLLQRSGVRLLDIIDHIAAASEASLQTFEGAGWSRVDQNWVNKNGLFPPVTRASARTIVFLRVESVASFLAANSVEAEIEGPPHGPLRRSIAFDSGEVCFGVVERNGYPGFEVPQVPDALIRQARLHHQAFRSRPRHFSSSEAGMRITETLIDAAVADLGSHWSCHLWFSAEREYWMMRCSAARIQKERQDRVGIGWSNIDHHTYDSSRRHFRHTLVILQKLGYQLREMIYAGELAGWGSQVLEQPVLGDTIFADVDLAPHETDIDFAHEELPDLERHRRAGLVCALHGESMLEGGLNHVAGLFQQETLRQQLQSQGLAMMNPFSDYPHLYQELTQGELIPVDPKKVDALEAEGHLGADESENIRLNGAVLSHLENIERNFGFKGFNKIGIDDVLRVLDPRASSGHGAATPAVESASGAA
jgi:hypothetical protein